MILLKIITTFTILYSCGSDNCDLKLLFCHVMKKTESSTPLGLAPTLNENSHYQSSAHASYRSTLLRNASVFQHIILSRYWSLGWSLWTLTFSMTKVWLQPSLIVILNTINVVAWHFLFQDIMILLGLNILSLLAKLIRIIYLSIYCMIWMNEWHLIHRKPLFYLHIHNVKSRGINFFSCCR